MGAVSYTITGNSNTSINYTMPSYVTKFWAACIGGGGSGEDYVNPSDDDGIYGGGGGAAAAGVLSGNIATGTVGRGGLRNGNGINGDASAVYDGVGGGVVANGGRAGGTGSQTGQGGSSSGGGGSGQDGERWQITLFAAGRGGGAGLIGGGNAGRSADVLSTCIEVVFGGFVVGGGGGNGASLPSGSGSGGATVGCTRVGGAGGDYGGGGGAVAAGTPTSIRGGAGGNGAAYISWVDISAPKTTLSSGESVAVTYSSPFLSSTTVNVSFTNNGTTSITETYTVTDGKGASSSIVFTIIPPVKIDYFYADPNPQTSGGDGIPNYNTSLNWNIVGGSLPISYTLNSVSIGNSSSLGTTVIYNVDDLPQSIAGSNSPATKTYTLTASDGYTSDTETITVSVYNDNTSSIIGYPPSSTTSGKALNNLEPNTQYVVIFGTISGIDMAVQFTGSSNLQVSKDNTTWTSGTILVSNGDTLYGRFNSLPFNTSRVQTGTNSSGLAIGSTNPQTLSFSLPYGNPPQGGIYTISTQTRAPVIQELFDAEGPTNAYPFPDIDTVTPNPNTDQYIRTGIDITNNDIEIPVEIKTDNPDVEISINSSQWITLRSIQ